MIFTDLGVYDIPAINAALNSLSCLFITGAYRSIRRGDRIRHRKLMFSAFASSALFLALYLIYHAQVKHVVYGGISWMRSLYLLVLGTHVVSAATLVPLVVLAAFWAMRGRIQAHRRVAPWALGIWLYVSLSGIAVYWLVRPYYPA